MAKFLLLSDTHGNLDIINQLAEKEQVDYVIHAGDFGFYDIASLDYLKTRELFLLIAHSKYWRECPEDKRNDVATLKEIVLRHQLLGDFPDYLSGKKKFDVPVYAVWGNHEDIHVIKSVMENPIDNLFLLDSHHVYDFDDIGSEGLKLFGLGGNFLASKKLFDKPIAGRGGKAWMTLHEIGRLYKKLKKKTKPSILVTHVSPGKEPLLTRIISHFIPDLWLSGHMGAPYVCTWNQFAIRELEDSLQWLDADTKIIDEYAETIMLTEEAQIGYDLLKREVANKDFWFKKLWNINLPDVPEGYAVLDCSDGNMALKTVSKGIHIL